MEGKSRKDRDRSTDDNRQDLELLQAMRFQVEFDELRLKKRALAKKLKKINKLERAIYKTAVLQTMKLVEKGKTKEEIIIELGLD